MSLWTKFRDMVVGGAKVAIGTALGGPIGGMIGGSIGRGRTPGTPPILPSTIPLPGVGVPTMQQSFVGPGVGAMVRVGGRILRDPRVRAGAAAAAGAVLGDLIIDEGTGQVIGQRRKRRRMNPCNPKALNRAVRRLAMYHKQNKKIEAQLRKLAPRPRRRAPAHHHDHHH